jgi:transposase-like protein
MATREQIKQVTQERQRRVFSPSFKEKKVREIEQKITTVSQVCKQYQVSNVAVYKWLSLYGDSYKKEIKTIVELESDTRKLLEMKARIAELEQIIGQKQIQIDFKDKMIELAEQMYGIDIKKKLGTKPSSGSGKTGKK